MSSFGDVLRGIRSRVEGTLAVSLIGLDGIAVETLANPDLPLDLMGAEFGSFIRSVRLSNTELDAGNVEQFSLVTDRYITFLSSVTPEYFILLVLSPDGNYGRARFELTKARSVLAPELS